MADSALVHTGQKKAVGHQTRKTMLRLGSEMTERHTLKRERAIAGGRDEKRQEPSDIGKYENE